MVHKRHILWLLMLLALPLLLLCSCGGGEVQAAGTDGGGTQAETDAETETDADADADTETETGSRSNTPVVYTPEATGGTVIGDEPLVVDISNRDQGYIMALYTGEAAKAGIQLTGPDGLTYKYFLPPSEEYVAIPLTAGDGEYELAAYENVTDNQYASLYKESFSVALENELLPYLYANVYVNFTAESEAVAAAAEIVSPASSDLEAVEDVYHYVVENITYDTDKASSVTSGYLPDVDETLETGKGICFDYAALTAAMLRSQSIPVRLEIGYVGEVYHAWISVYIEEFGWIDNLIEFTGDGWTRMDPTFASSNDNSSQILEYIGDGSNYTLQYLH